jgi:pantothenate kinase
LGPPGRRRHCAAVGGEFAEPPGEQGEDGVGGHPPAEMSARGFVALLRRVRAETDHDVYAPSFRRAVEKPIAGEITISAGAGLVVVEGNYLLVDSQPWRQVKPLLDEAWFCETPAGDRLLRLVDRHTRHGRTPQAATAWAIEVDGVNAQLIEATRGRADLLVSGTAPLPIQDDESPRRR